MNYRRVISFGDSFTFGSDLHDTIAFTEAGPDLVNDPQRQQYLDTQYANKQIVGRYEYEPDLHNRRRQADTLYSHYTWPALLAQHLKAEYICHARPGASNNQIARLVHNYIDEFNHYDLVVVNWTWIDRTEYHDDTKDPKMQWTQIRPDSSDNAAKVYYKHFFTELSAKYETLKNILAIQQLLNANGVNFLMTSIDELTVATEWHNPRYVDNIINDVQEDIVWFNGRSFFEWVKHNDFPISKTLHPLEEAHEAAFKYMRNLDEFA